ncbi:MAG: cytochrome c oxidase, subunit, partial [Rubritepida sp.]|nr:cytochrome c oxidase, subunit [Rubritepida sp.]
MSGVRDDTLTSEALHLRLLRTWSPQPGLIGWLTSLDHKSIGRRYMATAFVH